MNKIAERKKGRAANEKTALISFIVKIDRAPSTYTGFSRTFDFKIFYRINQRLKYWFFSYYALSIETGLL